MSYDEVAVGMAINEIAKVDPRHYRKIIKVIRSYQLLKALKCYPLNVRELESVAIYLNNHQRKTYKNYVHFLMSDIILWIRGVKNGKKKNTF